MLKSQKNDYGKNVWSANLPLLFIFRTITLKQFNSLITIELYVQLFCGQEATHRIEQVREVPSSTPVSGKNFNV